MLYHKLSEDQLSKTWPHQSSQTTKECFTNSLKMTYVGSFYPWTLKSQKETNTQMYQIHVPDFRNKRYDNSSHSQQYRKVQKVKKKTENKQQPDKRSYDVGNKHYDHQYHLSSNSFCQKNVVAYLKNYIETQAERLDLLSFKDYCDNGIKTIQ